MNQTRRPKGSPGGTGGQYAPGLEHADMLPDLSDYDTRGPVSNPDMRAMLTDYAGEHADDYDMDAVEAAYRDMLDKQLHTMGCPPTWERMRRYCGRMMTAASGRAC